VGGGLFPTVFFGFVLVALRQRLHRANISRRRSTAPADLLASLSPLHASPVHLPSVSVCRTAEVTFFFSLKIHGKIHLLLSRARARSDQAHLCRGSGCAAQFCRQAALGKLESHTAASPFPGGTG